jgi:hypothetical protein
MSYEPFTSNEFFISQANIIIINENHIIDIYRKLKEGILELKNKNIIFIKSQLLYRCINILKIFPSPYILITSCNLDITMPYISYPCNKNIKLSTDILLQSTNLIKWYTKNPSIQHEKIEPIPIGLKWQWTSQSFYGEDNTQLLSLYKSIASDSNAINNNFRKDKSNLIYFNFNINTTNNCFYSPHTNCRNKIKMILLKNGLKYNETLPFNDYMKTIATYKFIISPPGKGIDSHRTWEALLVGCIPIVLSSPLDSLYKELPILVVKDYSVVTEEYLNSCYQTMLDKEYDFSIMYSMYWTNKIK